MNARQTSGQGPAGSPLHVESAGNAEAAADHNLRAALMELPALLASAPHRLMFLAGATAVIVSMLWWAATLAAAWFGRDFPTPPVPSGWAHAVFTQFGMLPLFIFGFLLTVFPRWMGQPALQVRQYVPVFAGVFGGYLLVHVGLLGSRTLLLAGMAAMLGGWTAGLIALGGVLARNGGKDRHAVSCFTALVLGACGIAAFAAFTLGAPWQLAFVAIKLGTFGLLLPVFFTVCHRMLPFFSKNIVGADYAMYRPDWSLPTVWVLLLLHLGLELAHRQDWLWIADAPLALVFALHWLAWKPWRCLRPGLLAVLHLGFAWLPVAFALFAAQSWLAFTDHGFLLGRAPVHALTVGFFGSMLVAMVTRVTHGHSGRPLQMSAIPWLTFILLQVVVLMRLWAEVTTENALWVLLAACGWLAAFLPWVLRSLWIYLTPRLDGKPG